MREAREREQRLKEELRDRTGQTSLEHEEEEANDLKKQLDTSFPLSGGETDEDLESSIDELEEKSTVW